MRKIFALLLLLCSSVASAQTSATVATMADTVVSQIDGIPDLLAAFSYVFGIVLGIKALLKFKENNESKGQVKIGIAVAFFVASGLFLSLPTMIRIGYDTMGYDSVTKNPSYSYAKEKY